MKEDMKKAEKKIKGRGTALNPKNRFEELYLDDLDESVDYYPDEEERKIKTVYYNDSTKTILAKNDSPDISFTYSINPYRGCEHGCIYCYARPTHEYLGFSSGMDFETKIMVKRDAPKLLEEAFMKKSWEPQSIAFSGNTDCYQPLERKLKITRECMKVFLKFRNPVYIITKNALVQRDIDVLKEMAEWNIIRVVVSITTLKPELTRIMEPRTSTPIHRLQTLEALSKNGIPSTVNVAPIIPGLTDEEVPSILKAASEHGAQRAGMTILRLPYAVKDLFLDWVKREFPDRADKILNRIKDMRGGELYNSMWGSRMSGEGKWAETIRNIFKINCAKYKLNKGEYSLSKEHFIRGNPSQYNLFG